MSKINNQVIASSYAADDNKFVGEKVSLDTATHEKYKKEYSKFTKQILKDNPDLSFDYSHYPALTVSHNYSAVAVITPKLTDAGEKDFSNTYVALLADAFRHTDTLDALKNLMPSIGVDFNKFRVRDDLGEKQQLVEDSLEAIKDGSTDFKNYTNLRQAMKPLAVKVAAEVEDDFSFSNPELAKNDNDLNEANEARKNLNEDYNPKNVEDVSKKTKLHDGIKQALHDQNGRAADEDDWLERRMKELDLHFNHHKTPAYKNLPLPFIHDVTIHDKYNRELLSWRTGGGSIKIHEAGIFNENAGQLAAEAAYKKFGHGKVHFNVSASARERYKDNLGMIYEQKLNQLIKAGFEPEQIVFHKDWQYMVNDKIKEMKNLAEFDQATPEQVAEAEKATQDYNAKNQDVEGVKDAPDAPATPAPDGVPTKAAPVDSSPVNEQTIPDVPVSADVPAKAPVAAPVKQFRNKCCLVKTISGKDGENADPSKDKYNLIGQKGMVESMTPATLKEVIKVLAGLEGIDIKQIAGTWLSDEKVVSYSEFKKAETARHEGMTEEQIKESKEEYSFPAAYEVLKEMKEAAKLALASPDVAVADLAVDVAVDTVVNAELPAAAAEPVVGDVPDYVSEQIPDNYNDDYDFDKDILEGVFTNSFDEPTVAEPAPYSIEDTERFLAEAFDMPEVLESPEYADLQKARSKASGEEPEHKAKVDDSGIDFNDAVRDLAGEKEKIENAKKVVKSAIANETRKINYKTEVK
ncbi:hypothetical protein [Pseudomonas sp. MF4836]|uniref:hypothetical protein n=1 Tax=Pseudomonas sp. MF4836 TaxID=1960827 RepID=UPI0009973049|nr:hypothetical protein [Pseudomonas sp. MF4836]OOV98450.1 hypothetical protein MF4836_08870 [Pseudomonas sp. MF4836]